MTDYDKELDDLLEGVYHRGNTDGLNDEWNPDNLGDAKAKLSALLRRAEVEAKMTENELYKLAWREALRLYKDDYKLVEAINKLIAAADDRIRELEVEL